MTTPYDAEIEHLDATALTSIERTQLRALGLRQDGYLAAVERYRPLVEAARLMLAVLDSYCNCPLCGGQNAHRGKSCIKLAAALTTVEDA